MILRLLFLLVPSLLLAAPSEQVDWFRLLPRVQDSWHVTPHPSDPDRIDISSNETPDQTPFRVIVLFSKSSSAYDVAMAQMLTTFSEKNIPALFTLIHFHDDEAQGRAALAWAEQARYELVFSMGSDTTAFLVSHYTDGRIPVVTVCSKDPVLMGQVPDYEQGSNHNIAFTSLDLPIQSQMAYLQRLKPNLTQIAVLYARDNLSAIKTQVEPILAICRRDQIATYEIVVETQANAREELTEKVPSVAALMKNQDPLQQNSILWITGSTAVFREIVAINAAAGKFPVLSVVPNVVREGSDSAVLSIGVSFENNAQIAALYGSRILTGQAKVGTLPVGVVSPPDIAINFKKAREIGLKIPFSFFESASFVYDQHGILVRANGQKVSDPNQ